MMGAIGMTAYRRPEYTKRVLDGLASNPQVGEYTLFAACEPGYPEVVDLFETINFMEWNLWLNNEVVGCNVNTYYAWRLAFLSGVDFAIYLDDDTVPAPDFLDYMEWAATEYADDPEIFAVGGYNKTDARPEQYHHVIARPWQNSWGIGTWRDRWQEMDADWNFDYQHGMTWDTYCAEFIKGDRLMIYPVLARIQNIGKYGGAHNDPATFDETQFNAHWAGDRDVKQSDIWIEDIWSMEPLWELRKRENRRAWRGFRAMHDRYSAPFGRLSS